MSKTETPPTYTIPGFQDQFTVCRNDGQPLGPTSRYIVIDYTGKDPSAIPALEKYADEAQANGNTQFANDIRAAIKDPRVWPHQTAAGMYVFLLRDAQNPDDYYVRIGSETPNNVVATWPLHSCFAAAPTPTVILAPRVKTEQVVDAALLDACREVAKFADCEDAADWKDASARLIDQCRKAAEPYK